MGEFKLIDSKKPENPLKIGSCKHHCYYESVFRWRITKESELLGCMKERKVSPFFEVDPKSKWHAEINKKESNVSLCVVRKAKIFREVRFFLSVYDHTEKRLYKNHGEFAGGPGEINHKLTQGDVEEYLYDSLKSLDGEIIFEVTLEVPADVSDLAVAFCPPADMLESLSTDINNIVKMSFINTALLPMIDMNTMIASSYFLGKILAFGKGPNASDLKKLETYMDTLMLKHVDSDTTLSLYRIAHKHSMLDLKQKSKQSLLAMKELRWRR